MLTGLIVLARILANPLANVFQKRLTQRSAHPVVVIGVTHGLMTLAVLPLAVDVPWASFGRDFWLDMTLTAVLAATGNVFLVAALRSSDLSILGPINSYKAVVSLALGVVLLGEVPNARGAAGVLLMVVGSVLIVDRLPGQRRTHAFGLFLRDPGVQLRVAALVCSATEAVIAKRAILQGSAMAVFCGWVVLGFVLAAMTSVALLRSEASTQARAVARDWTTYLWLAFATAAMQLATLFALRVLQVGYTIALFQLSSVVSVLFGAHLFAERNIRRRLAGSLVMVAGAALIVTIGR